MSITPLELNGINPNLLQYGGRNRSTEAVTRRLWRAAVAPLPGSHRHSELPSLWVRAALCQLMARLGPGRPNQHIWERKSCSHTPLAMKPAPGIDKDSSCEGFQAQMSTSSSSESARPAAAVQTACELQALCTPPVRAAQIAAPPFSKNTFIMPTLPISIFLCLLFQEPVSSFSLSHHVTILLECAHPRTPHLPCARGCKGRVGCPGWMVSSP